jgi:hypothetical protein
MLAYDVAHERMSELAELMSGHASQRNEAATRLQLIDRLIFDCLGWSKDRALPEAHQAGEFADYLLDDEVRRLVVEAKREGAWFELPVGVPRVAKLEALYALGGAVASALEQVEAYAQHRGVPYAAICNGHQLIAFVASRSDGVSPREGRALVFGSPEELVDGFPELWESLSPQGCGTMRLTAKLHGTAAAPPPKLSEHIRDYPGTARTSERNHILSTLSVLFKPPYVRDDEYEDEFLRECYCPPGAYSQLALLNRGVLRTRYSTALGEDLHIGLEAARTKDGLNPHLIEEVAITSAGREPLVLLGPVGVGKTMFLRHLLRIDAKELAENAVVLYVDLGRSAVLEDLDSYIAGSFRQQLNDHYGVDIHADEFLRGSYYDEVKRFAAGVNAPLRELDPAEFKKREIDHLLELASHPETHLRRSLEHLVKLRSQQVIIVLDNIDQRNREDQEQTFLIAETIAKTWPCTVFITLRPETFNASALRGTLSGYQPRAFTINAPRVERVIVQRLRFGSGHYEREGRLPQWLGWTAQSDDLRTYLSILEKSFQRNTRLQSLLINLSGGNARRALDLLATFVQSPHANADSMIVRNKKRDYLIPHHVFLRAVLLGSANHYQPSRSRVPNLFDISTADPREHFLLPCVLGLLRRASEEPEQEGYVTVETVFDTFQNAGFEPSQIDFALQRLRDGELAEQIPPDGQIRSVRLTTVGAYAHEQLPREYTYLDVVTVDTPVGNPAIRGQLVVVEAVRPRLERADLMLGYLDGVWGQSQLGLLGLFDWPACSATVRAEVEMLERRL